MTCHHSKLVVCSVGYYFWHCCKGCNKLIMVVVCFIMKDIIYKRKMSPTWNIFLLLITCSLMLCSSNKFLCRLCMWQTCWIANCVSIVQMYSFFLFFTFNNALPYRDTCTMHLHKNPNISTKCDYSHSIVWLLEIYKIT